MGTASENIARFGITGPWGWWIGSAIGGGIGALAFGALIWLVDPGIVETAIPDIYGLEREGMVGWGIHVVHGIGLGLVFGLIVSRKAVLSWLTEDVETDALARTGLVSRLVGAGFVFGLAIWAVLPVIVLPVWIEVGGIGGGGAFPQVAVESLIGHLLYGTILGIVVGLSVDFSDRLE